MSFNTQPPEGGWNMTMWPNIGADVFQHTAARRRLGSCFMAAARSDGVSTHSRPKAAGLITAGWYIYSSWFQHTAARRRLGVGKLFFCWLAYSFNTQPPEGGWQISASSFHAKCRFQHTAARRRLGCPLLNLPIRNRFNTQPPEGGWKANLTRQQPT